MSDLYETPKCVIHEVNVTIDPDRCVKCGAAKRWAVPVTDDLLSRAEWEATIEDDLRLLRDWAETCDHIDHHGYCQTHAVTPVDENGLCGIGRLIAAVKGET